MRRQVFKSKIHRATITQADLDYEGSLTIDEDLMEAADILEWEAVHVWNVTRGSRLMTYAIKGERGSGVMCMNGAAAHLTKPGDLVIVATFSDMEDAEARKYEPTVVFVDEQNRIREKGKEIAGPLRRAV